MRKFLSFLAGAVSGATVGATVALLLTPGSGPELRQQFSMRLAELIDESKRAAVERRIELETQLADLKKG